MTLPAAARHPPRRGVLLSLATLAQIGVSFAQQGVVVLGVFFAAAYHLTLAQMGLVTSCISLGWMFAGLITGALIDRLGPRVVLSAGTLVMSAMAVVVAASSNLIVICLALVVLGMALSAAPLAGTKSVLLAWSREERGLPMGIRQMGVPAGSMAAALILPTLATFTGIHGIFWIFAGEMLAAGLLFAGALPRQGRGGAGPAPAVSPGLRRDLRHVALPGVCGFLLAWGQYVLLTFSIPMLHIVAGLSVPAAGVVLSLAQVGGGLARVILGGVSDRLHGRRDLVIGVTAASATLLAVVVAWLPGGASGVVLGVLWLLLGSVMVGWNALLLTWAGERVAVDHAGAAMGLTTSCVLFGAVVSAPIFGLVVQATGGFRGAWLVLAGVLGLATALLWWGARSWSLPAHCALAFEGQDGAADEPAAPSVAS